MIKPKMAALGAVVIACAGLSAAPSLASDQASFVCVAGDISYVMVFDGNDLVTVEESFGEMIEGEPGTFELMAQPSASGFSYTGNGYTFFGKGNEAALQEGDFAPIPCEPYEAMPISQNHESGAVGGNEGPVIDIQGQSLGGRLRDGPGTNFGAIGSLDEGTWLTIVRNTGVQFNGYDWFEVRLDSGVTAYHWGGIMCANGAPVPGIYATCGSN